MKALDTYKIVIVRSFKGNIPDTCSHSMSPHRHDIWERLRHPFADPACSCKAGIILKSNKIIFFIIK